MDEAEIEEEPPVKESAAEAGHCPFCQTGIFEGEAVVGCKDCHTQYHADCWAENEGCAIYGCQSSADTIKWDDNQIPVSYWGKEHKSCPNCSQEILAAALRCKHCGTVFKSAKPTNSDEFAIDKNYEQEKSKLKRKTAFVFFANAIPLLGILALLIGGIWVIKNRKFIRKLPGVNRTMCHLGLIVGATQVLLFTVLGIIYSLSN